MKRLELEVPDQMAKELEELVRTGWFVSEAEIARQALVGFLRHHRYALQEQYQLDDIRWALGLREKVS